MPIVQRNSECFPRALLAGLRPLRMLELGTAMDYSVLVMVEELPPSTHTTTVENYMPRIARAKENLVRYGVGRTALIEDDAFQVL